MTKINKFSNKIIQAIHWTKLPNFWTKLFEHFFEQNCSTNFSAQLFDQPSEQKIELFRQNYLIIFFFTIEYLTTFSTKIFAKFSDKISRPISWPNSLVDFLSNIIFRCYYLTNFWTHHSTIFSDKITWRIVWIDRSIIPHWTRLLFQKVDAFEDLLIFTDLPTKTTRSNVKNLSHLHEHSLFFHLPWTWLQPSSSF